MTVTTSPPYSPTVSVDDHRPSWRAKRRRTRQLRLRDETSARLAELDHMTDILNQAAELIGGGWLQHSWFAYLDDNGRTRTVTAHNVNRMAGRPVVGACLVGAIVQAGGGLSNVRSCMRSKYKRTAGPRLLRFVWTACETSPAGTITRTGPRPRQRHCFAVARLQLGPKPPACPSSPTSTSEDPPGRQSSPCRSFRLDSPSTTCACMNVTRSAMSPMTYGPAATARPISSPESRATFGSVCSAAEIPQ